MPYSFIPYCALLFIHSIHSTPCWNIKSILDCALLFTPYSTPCWAHHTLSKRACAISTPYCFLSVHSTPCWNINSILTVMPCSSFTLSTPCWGHHPLSKKARAIPTLRCSLHALLGYERHTVPCCSVHSTPCWDINSILTVVPCCLLLFIHSPHPAGLTTLCVRKHMPYPHTPLFTPRSLGI